MRMIDADALDKVKFHPLPYTHITPSDADAESYKRGWNDAIDAIMSEAPTIEERKKGKWIVNTYEHAREFWDRETTCSICGYKMGGGTPNYCPNCGARMKKPMTIPEEIINSVLGYDD